MLAHVPTYTVEQLLSMKKREAITVYEAKVTYFVDMGAVMPECDDDHREDVEIALADMERQQAWLIKVEELLIARDLQGSVEDEVKEGLETATAQLLEAWEHVKEWKAQDARQVLEQQRAEAAQEQRTRRMEGERSRKRRATESDEDEPETSMPQPKQLHKEAGNMAAEDGEEEAAKDEELEAEEITPPNDILVYGPYDASAPSGHPGSTAWGCAAGATRKKVCPHPVVRFTQERHCLHCKSAGTPCIGTGCCVCCVCKKRKIECSHTKHHKHPEKVEKVRASRVSGSRTSAVKPKTPTKARGQPVDEGETSGTVQASKVAATIPVIHPAYVEEELRVLQQKLGNADAHALVLMEALEEVNVERRALSITLGAAILHWEERRVRAVAREMAERSKAIEGHEEDEESEQEN
ncbi:hypothetical protein BDN71DRAFT_1507540 [Pleurotus eryngii]|uniref:Uncharacterized protein n=1 Tax=Pleurotus eryngii TaxID=5323 RepID=A0A9P6DFH1_PLEER|nr:hypothetical protein BDN71DRAFT_1507540 [Pleurotus eryngii]